MESLKFDRTKAITYGLPLLVIIISVFIALSPILLQYPELATAITYDLPLLAPILFLLLSRKTNEPKLRAVPFFVGGIAIATYLLPDNGQEHLDYLKTYLLPIVELTILAIVGRKIYYGIKTYKSHSVQSTDFYVVSKKSSQEVFGKSRFASFFTSEITMMYYALFSWRKTKLLPNKFTNYKENGSIALMGALLMIVFIETFALHMLLMKWNTWVAWGLTITSIYTAFMILGHLKALLQRPSLLSQNELNLKNGLIADININLKAIERIELFSKEIQSENLKIGNLGLSKESTNHNIAIHFKTPQTIEKIYGFTEECDVLLVHLDDKNNFIKKVNLRLDELD